MTVAVVWASITAAEVWVVVETLFPLAASQPCVLPTAVEPPRTAVVGPASVSSAEEVTLAEASSVCVADPAVAPQQVPAVAVEPLAELVTESSCPAPSVTIPCAWPEMFPAVRWVAV